MTESRELPKLDLDYQAKNWLIVPTFGERAELDAWIATTIRESHVAAPFDSPPESEVLPEVLEGQWGAIAGDATLALWFCPYGLPAAGVLEVRLELAEAVDDPVRAYVEQLPSAIEVYPRDVSTPALGKGLGISRIVVDEDGDSWGEIDYVFLWEDYLVIVQCSSGENSVLTLMGSESWDIVESLRVHP